MKKNLLIPSTLIIAGALSLGSCSEDPAGGKGAKGSLVPCVDIDGGFIGLEVTTRAGEDLTTDDLTLTVTSSDGSYVQTWDSFGDFNPAEEQFPIGDYTVAVAYGDRDAEGFENRVVAAYYDSQDVKILEGTSTPVELTASRTHAIVNITYTEAFERYIKSGAVDLISSTGNGITYVYNDDRPETRSSLIVPGLTKVLVDIEKYNGTWIHNVEAAKFITKARGSYTVKLDVNEGSLGSASLSIIIDDNVTEEIVEVDISDDVVEADPPEIVLEGIAPDGKLTVVEGTYAGDPIKVNFIAKGELAEVNFIATSTFLDRRGGWEASTSPEGVDLLSLEQGQQGKYKNLGFDCHGIWNQPGRLAVIDMTKVINCLEYLEKNEPLHNLSTFTFVARDKYNKVSDPISFSIQVLPIELSLLNPSYLKIFDTEVELDMSFNGGDPTGMVKFNYKNERGTDEALKIESLTHLSGDLYRVKLSGLPADEYDLEITAEINGRSSNVLTVPRHGVIAYASDNDTFANWAYIAMKAFNLSESDVESPKFTLVSSENNKNLQYTKYDDNVYIVKGLTPEKLNHIEVSFDDPTIYCTSVDVTAESTTALKNGNFNEPFEIVNKGSNWQEIDVLDNWGTNNPMTTSQGGNFAYVRISGTIQTSDAHTGSGAALIRTVGWGSGNSAVGSMSGEMKYADAGLLHLGSSRKTRPSGYSGVQGALTTDDLDCGIDFTSRPSSVSFWYKYAPKNSADQGKAEIWVKDENGNIISSMEISLPKADSYTKMSLPFKYEYGAPKAAKLYIKFLSTNNREFLKKDASYITPPPFGGSGGKATYMGSQLYIDDVELIY